MKRRMVTIILALIITVNLTQVVGLMTLSPVIQSGTEGGTTITWNIEACPEVPFTWGWSGDGRWLAEEGGKMSFAVNRTSPDVAGTLNIGNLSIYANDTDIARELVLGVWGATQFFPGLVIDIDNASIIQLNETAYASAKRVKGNYLNGTMNAYYKGMTVPAGTFSCIVFEYEQDPTSFGQPQKTTLVYDLDTGVLVWANTSYSFGTQYILTLELDSIVQHTNPFNTLLLYGIIGGIVAIAVTIMALKRR